MGTFGAPAYSGTKYMVYPKKGVDLHNLPYPEASACVVPVVVAVGHVPIMD